MELHYHMDCDLRNQNLAERMAERRRKSLAATRRSSLRARMARMLFALDVATEKQEAWPGRVWKRGTAHKRYLTRRHRRTKCTD